MEDNAEVWPPAPGPQNTPAAAEEGKENGDIAICPTCKRRLLTHTSALCNWCGAKIDNPEYQTKAAQNRLERDRQERAELEAVIQEETRHGILGRLKRLGKQAKNGSPREPLG